MNHKPSNGYFTEHPELIDGLPEHWKSFSNKPWFPYVVGALARPDERMRKQLLIELGQPDMPERVWQFANSSFMLSLAYKWPPVTMSGTEDAQRLFRQHLILTYEDDLASHDLVADVSQDSGQDFEGFARSSLNMPPKSDVLERIFSQDVSSGFWSRKNHKR